jgi:hypothetical protein
MVNCELSSLEVSFQGTRFGHAFFKACQYEIVKEKKLEKKSNIFSLSMSNLIYKSA